MSLREFCVNSFVKARFEFCFTLNLVCKFIILTYFCHTGALAEVSINLKCFLKFFGFFAAAMPCNQLGRFLSKVQNDKSVLSLHYKNAFC